MKNIPQMHILLDFAIPIVVFMFYILASLELITAEIEDPFGKDENDLPMQLLAATIKKGCRRYFILA